MCDFGERYSSCDIIGAYPELIWNIFNLLIHLSSSLSIIIVSITPFIMSQTEEDILCSISRFDLNRYTCISLVILCKSFAYDFDNEYHID